jgi:hypothetical protein
LPVGTFSGGFSGVLALLADESKVAYLNEPWHAEVDPFGLGPVYEVYIVPSETSLAVDGKKISISSGMSLTAEIKTGKRRIIDFFVYPIIKYLDEGIKVR